jgi:hypothetical protein
MAFDSTLLIRRQIENELHNGSEPMSSSQTCEMYLWNQIASHVLSPFEIKINYVK